MCPVTNEHVTNCENATDETPASSSPMPNTYSVCSDSVLQMRTCACDLRSRPARCPDATSSRDGCTSILYSSVVQLSGKSLTIAIALTYHMMSSV